MNARHLSLAVTTLILWLLAFPVATSMVSAQNVRPSLLGADLDLANGMINASLVPGRGNGDIGDKINAAMAQRPGGSILVPDGTYSFSTSIEPPANAGSGVTVNCGSTNTVLQYTGSGDAIHIHNPQAIGTSIVFRNCTIDGSKASGPSANGVHIQSAQGVSFFDCVVKNFKGYGVYNQGAIAPFFSNVMAATNGVNLVDVPDEATHMSTNGVRWIGGSLQYGGRTNYWEAPNSAGRNQENLLETIFEMSAPVPQAIIEACDSCTIRNSYVEYIGVSGVAFPPVVIGNAPQSGYGSQTSQIAKHLRLENDLTFFPSSSRGYEVQNVQGLTLNDLDEQGRPDCTIEFASDPTIGISDVNIIAGLYNWGVARFKNPRNSYFGQFR
jgi:hypothetical protein